jgi:hypothetical protein
VGTFYEHIPQKKLKKVANSINFSTMQKAGTMRRTRSALLRETPTEKRRRLGPQPVEAPKNKAAKSTKTSAKALKATKATSTPASPLTSSTPSGDGTTSAPSHGDEVSRVQAKQQALTRLRERLSEEQRVFVSLQQRIGNDDADSISIALRSDITKHFAKRQVRTSSCFYSDWSLE